MGSIHHSFDLLRANADKGKISSLETPFSNNPPFNTTSKKIFPLKHTRGKRLNKTKRTDSVVSETLSPKTTPTKTRKDVSKYAK